MFYLSLVIYNTSHFSWHLVTEGSKYVNNLIYFRTTATKNKCCIILIESMDICLIFPGVISLFVKMHVIPFFFFKLLLMD